MNNKILFKGTPSELLEELNNVASHEGIYTCQRDWPKNRNWLVKRINNIKSNLQQLLAIKITINRDSNNSSIIKIERNISGISGEHNISPENENSSPYLDSLSPVSNELSPEEEEALSTNSLNSGDAGYTGDKLGYIMEDIDEESDNSININNKCINCPKPSDSRIEYNHPFYYCKDHSNFQNIHLEVIESHLILAKDHKSS
jgi:hypothetical protein